MQNTRAGGQGKAKRTQLTAIKICNGGGSQGFPLIRRHWNLSGATFEGGVRVSWYFLYFKRSPTGFSLPSWLAIRWNLSFGSNDLIFSEILSICCQNSDAEHQNDNSHYQVSRGLLVVNTMHVFDLDGWVWLGGSSLEAFGVPVVSRNAFCYFKSVRDKMMDGGGPFWKYSFSVKQGLAEVGAP